MPVKKKIHFNVNYDQVADRLANVAGIKATGRAVANELGLSPSNYSNYKRRGTLVHVFVDWAIQNGVSIDWLLTGEDPPSTAPPQLTIQTVPRFKSFAKNFAFEEYIPIRLLGGSVAGGAPSEVREEDIAGWALIYASRDWMPTDPENYTCVHVKGKSMYPVLTDGDIVAIDHSQKDPTKLDGKMVAFRVNGGGNHQMAEVRQERGDRGRGSRE